MAISSIRKVEQVASLRDRISESLSAAIISGELAPGTLVSVPTLASQFAVSATPVREAMLDLEQRGFVASVRNKGFRVTEVSEQDLREIVELRQLIEAPAMRQLAGSFPVETLPQWRALAEQIAVHADSANLTGFIESDRGFHLGLLGLYGNVRLVDMVHELRSQTRMVNLARMTKSDELLESAREHHLMLDLLERGDGPALEQIQHEVVFASRFEELVALRHPRQVDHSGLRAQLMDHVDQPYVSVETEQPQMEVPVRLDEAGEVGVVGVHSDLLGERAPLRQGLHREAPGELAHCRRLDQLAQLDDLPKILLADLGDPESLVANRCHEPALLEVEHRLTDRGG